MQRKLKECQKDLRWSGRRFGELSALWWGWPSVKPPQNCPNQLQPEQFTQTSRNPRDLTATSLPCYRDPFHPVPSFPSLCEIAFFENQQNQPTVPQHHKKSNDYGLNINSKLDWSRPRRMITPLPQTRIASDASELSSLHAPVT